MRNIALSFLLLLAPTTASAIRMGGFSGSCTSDNVQGLSADGQSHVLWIVSPIVPPESAILLGLVAEGGAKNGGLPLEDPHLFWWHNTAGNIKLLVGKEHKGGFTHYFLKQGRGWKYRRGSTHTCNPGIE